MKPVFSNRTFKIASIIDENMKIIYVGNYLLPVSRRHNQIAEISANFFLAFLYGYVVFEILWILTIAILATWGSRLHHLAKRP